MYSPWSKGPTRVGHMCHGQTVSRSRWQRRNGASQSDAEKVGVQLTWPGKWGKNACDCARTQLSAAANGLVWLCSWPARVTPPVGRAVLRVGPTRKSGGLGLKAHGKPITCPGKETKEKVYFRSLNFYESLIFISEL